MKPNAIQTFVRVRPCERQAEAFCVTQGGKAVQVRQEVKDASNKTTSAEYVTFACEALEHASQARTFDAVGRPVVDAVMDGYNGTVLCYGQTGAGKTFTMMGSRDNYDQRGLAARAIGHVFREMANRPQFEYKVRISCLELYNDTMHDLLSSLPSEGGPHELSLSEQRGETRVKGLMQPEVDSEQAALELLFTAETNRIVAQHQLNAVSSRSHVLYMLHVERRSRVANGALTTARLTLVDLAGSERLKKSGGGPVSGGGAFGGENGEAASSRAMMKEAMAINKSLSFLEQVVVAVGSRKAHVPHRSSKLTAVLRESLGGNCKTVLVANVWPEERQLEETLSTLRFATRMQAITNAAVVNSHAEVTPQQALAACQQQVHDLKRELAMHDQLSGRGHISYEPLSDAQRTELRSSVLSFLEGVGGEPQAATLRQVRETYELFRQLYAEQAAQLRELSERPCPCQGQAAHTAVSLSAEAEASPPVEVVEMVGELDEAASGEGFSVGVAPPGARPADPAFHRQPPLGAVDDHDDATDAAHPPPAAPSDVSPDVYFGEFKLTVGAEVHSLLLENKRKLKANRARQRELGTAVNMAKYRIDDLKAALERKREARSLAPSPTPEVIDDEEFRLVAEVREAKAEYRAAFEALTDEKGSVDFLAQTVENCRTQLLADFSTFLKLEHPELGSRAEEIAAAATGADASSTRQPSLLQPSLLQPSAVSATSGYGGAYGSGDSAFGFGSGFGASSIKGSIVGPPGQKLSPQMDEDEQFEAMADQMVLASNPDALPFFKASKLAGARQTRKNRRPSAD